MSRAWSGDESTGVQGHCRQRDQEAGPLVYPGKEGPLMERDHLFWVVGEGFHEET